MPLLTDKLILLLAGHFLGDFTFQSEWMVKEKGKSWEINLYHAISYTATVFVTAFFGGVRLSVAAILVLVVAHFLVDALRSRYGVIKSIWAGQIWHVLVVLAIVYFSI